MLAGLSCPAADGVGLHTVVIDAGHGGKDAGAVSKDGKTLEKNITLDIAKRLSAKINSAYPEVKVVLTRSDDRYVALNDRARIANKAGANLFVSLHVNSTAKTSPNGYSVHILGQSSNRNRDLYAYNRDVCQRENSVILLEEDYSTTYQGFNPNDPESYIFMTLMQGAYLEQSMRFAQSVKKHLAGGPVKVDRGISQDPFWVLWATSMPAVLVEMGFISNNTDLAQLLSAAGREELSERLFKAFREYKVQYDYSVSSSAPPQGGRAYASGGAGEPPAAEAAAQGRQPALEQRGAVQDNQGGADKTEYGVQILALGREIDPSSSMFMGYAPKRIKTGGVYKYFIAVSDSEQQSRSSLSSIKEKYPDAFLVRIEGENVTRVR